MTTATSDRYTIISSDCHAGANHKTYREYLESSWHDEFDAWRGKYRNPFRDLQDDGRSRNWDNDRRISEQHTDGVVAEITFPNTVPPFFPTGTLIAPQPTDNDLPRRLAGIRAHNRWLADFCDEYPERRAGIGQIFLNDIDEAVADVAWIAEHNLRGGALIPSIAPNSDLPPLFHPRYDPVWAACEEHDVVMTLHSGGTGMPNYGDSPAAGPMFVIETPFFSNRSMWHRRKAPSAVSEAGPGEPASWASPPTRCCPRSPASTSTATSGSASASPAPTRCACSTRWATTR